jgi:hypothetical protein
MINDEGGASPEKELPAKPVLNDRGSEAGDGEKRAEAVRRDTGAIDADAAHDRSS